MDMNMDIAIAVAALIGAIIFIVLGVLCKFLDDKLSALGKVGLCTMFLCCVAAIAVCYITWTFYALLH